MAQEIADSTLLDTWGSGGNIVEPDISKIIEGWQLGEQPPHEYMNWLQNTFGSKLNHILKNGVASWNNTTQYLAGSSVQHNGNIWLCKTTNTNSEPTDANANWKRIITVESLTTVLNGYVLINSKHSLNANVALTISNNIITLRKGDGTTDTIDLTSAFQNNAFGLGIGQTVQNVTASRSADVTYTNTTGKPIFVTITGVGGGGTLNRYGVLTVDGATVSTMGTTSSTQNFSCSFVIPNGSTYKYTHSNMPIQFWHELR